MKSCHYRFCPPRLWLLATAPSQRYHFDFSLKNGIDFRSLIYQLHRLYSCQLSRMLSGCCSSYIALFYPSKRPQSLGSRFRRLRRCRILRLFGTTQVYSAASTSYRIPIQIFSWYRRWSGCLCCRGRVGWMLLGVLWVLPGRRRAPISTTTRSSEIDLVAYTVSGSFEYSIIFLLLRRPGTLSGPCLDDQRSMALWKAGGGRAW